MTARKVASVGSILLGIILVVGGVTTWIMVGSTLAAQRITTPEDACLPEREVAGPFTAYCQARPREWACCSSLSASASRT